MQTQVMSQAPTTLTVRPKKRTKTGCLTCRRRRIKCDESKPVCKNCTKAKKQCEQVYASNGVRLAARPIENVQRSFYETLSPDPGPALSRTTLHGYAAPAPVYHTALTPDRESLMDLVPLVPFLPIMAEGRAGQSGNGYGGDAYEVAYEAGYEDAYGDGYRDKSVTRYRAGLGETMDAESAKLFRHFVREVHINFTVDLDEGDHDGGDQDQHCDKETDCDNKQKGFWTGLVPGLCMQSAALLHACLAISATHLANVTGTANTASLVHYHRAMRKLGRGLCEPRAMERDDLLCASLILAYYETMCGECVRWGRHLAGARDMVTLRLNALVASQQQATLDKGNRTNTTKTSTELNLIWFYIHQDTTQALLSGNGLFLSLAALQQVPTRGKPGSVTRISDELRLLLARLGNFVPTDRKRKQSRADDPTALSLAVAQWQTLWRDFSMWHATLLQAVANPGERTGAASRRNNNNNNNNVETKGQLTLYLGALIYMQRCHPTQSPIPSEAIAACAPATAGLCVQVMRLHAGILADSRDEASGANRASHQKAMINAMLPVLLAGVQIRDAVQRDWLDSSLADVFAYTGWRTAVRVQQGLQLLWQKTDLTLGQQKQSLAYSYPYPHAYPYPHEQTAGAGPTDTIADPTTGGDLDLMCDMIQQPRRADETQFLRRRNRAE